MFRYWCCSSTLVVVFEHKQALHELLNHIPVLLEAPKPYTSAPGESRNMHWRSCRIQNLTLALQNWPESCTSAPGGCRSLQQCFQKLQILAPVLSKAPDPCTRTFGGSRFLHWCSQRIAGAYGASAECDTQNQPLQPLEGPRASGTRRLTLLIS
jgi:hypothetical protein